MPKYLWRPYRNAVNSVEYYEQTLSRLAHVSGYDAEKLIKLFAAGYTLRPPEFIPEGMLQSILFEEE